MNNQLIKDKLKASAIHFVGSIIVVSLAAYLIFCVWYPTPFFKLYQVMAVFLLLVLVDVILGPLFTFIVYKKGKKTLKMDLLVILIVQIAAFVFGMKSIADARPAWLVHYQDVLYATSPNMIIDAAGEKKPVSYIKQNWGSPKVMQVQDGFHDEAQSADIPVIHQLDKLTAMNQLQISDKQLSLDLIKEYDAGLYQHIIESYPTVTGYLPILTEASIKVPAALINKDGELVKIILEDKDK